MRRPLTLQRALVIGVSALVAAALLVMSIATVVALRAFVDDRLDEQVRGALAVAGGHGPGGPNDRGDEAEEAPNGRGPEPRIGSLQVVVDAAGDAQAATYTQEDGTAVTLSDDQVALLVAHVPTDRTPVTVDLGSDLGPFRVAAQASDDGTVIAGMSLADARATTIALTMILAAVGGLTLLATIGGLTLLVRRMLRPLDRVAAVAQRVTAQPLGRGDVEIADRVLDRDTDERTEVGRVGAALNDLLGHVQGALAARAYSESELRRFIADASHELRTPLASVRGYAQLTLTGPDPLSDTQRRSIERVESEARRMAALVDDLLLLARLDAGQRLADGDVELALVAIDAVNDAQTVDPDRQWRLRVAPDAAEVVPGDEDRLRQVIANLLRNAQTHTPPGTIVTTSLEREGDEAVLRVDDTGPGIDPAVRERLFERFARGDHSRSRSAGSTGLGLSIAHAIVTAHGGTIAVASSASGATFTVRLPIVRPPVGKPVPPRADKADS